MLAANPLSFLLWNVEAYLLFNVRCQNWYCPHVIGEEDGMYLLSHFLMSFLKTDTAPMR